MADGENIERFWSSLGQLAYITREMSASPRQDLLVDALLHMGKKVLVNAPKTMVRRSKAAKMQAVSATAEMDRLCANYQGDYLHYKLFSLEKKFEENL